MNEQQSMPLRVHATRLEPGADLRAELVKFARDHHLGAGCILGAVGSVISPRLRLANQKSPTQMEGCFEILSLSGTLSSSGIHLHVMIADSTGQCYGGHLVEGCPVHTTAEIVIAELSAMTFTREPDPRTGHRELKIDPRQQPG